MVRFREKKNPRILIVGLITPNNIFFDSKSYFEEFENLVNSNNIFPIAKYFSNLRSIDPSTFLTKGKLEEVKNLCIKENIDEIIISEILTPHQEEMLEKKLGVDVYDRTSLILEIFENRAQSAEAKLQIKMAFLEHKKTRVSGRGKYFSQQAGRIGEKGPGETQKTIDLNHIEHLLLKIKREIKSLHNVRSVQRKKRLKIFKTISLIGYTNAGKSTIFNALTKSDVLVEDKLFATLDTTTREIFFDNKKKAVLSDTVGFIQNIPHKLIEAFKSTLEELQYSDLLLHVVDISDKNWEEHINVVKKLLKELKVEDKKQILIANKIDKISIEKIDEIKIKLEKYSNFILISSKNINDLLLLKKSVEKKIWE